jgi:hypothetical protein
LIRATLFRAFVVAAAVAGALAPVRCLGEDGKRLPEKATRELSARTTLGTPPKEDAETFGDPSARFQGRSRTRSLEAGYYWPLPDFQPTRSVGGRAILVRKLPQGDRQTPEGFYTITPKLMNPNSNFYLAINTGFPNAFDKANDRDGTFLMIHGDCSSSGCYAMTDEQIGEIYALARDSLLGGHPSFQVQAYPFRLTQQRRLDPNISTT